MKTGFSIRQTRFASGERFVLLAAGRHEAPDSWVAGYTATTLRGRSFHTVENKLAGIAHGLAFARDRNLGDLRSRVLERLPDNDELSALSAYCSSRAGGGDPLVKADAHYGAFVDYLLWLHEQPTGFERDPVLAAAARHDFRSRAAAYAPVSAEGAEGTRLGLTDEQRDLFLRVIRPGAEGNPFGAMAFRNFTMLSLSFCLGLRAGELRGIKVCHLDTRRRPGRLLVVRNEVDDPADRRREPAMQKTLERELSLSNSLTLACDELVRERDRQPAARRHPFLLVNMEGAPLSPRGMRTVFQTLREGHPSLRDLVNHQLRHDWNDRWSELVKAKGWDLTRSQDIQLHAMGWKPGSAMPARYSKRSRQEEANEALAAMHETSTPRRSRP